ncbi:hypothetical protein KGP36_02910 [Patescibacteria group bacterium]|nr:hypothetical protein [Patescibacteria group bacterium]
MQESTKTSRVEFTPPSDFKPPENSSPDKDWDMVCSFRTKPDGKVCMTKLGDTDMPGYGSKEGKDRDEEKEHTEKPDYGELSSGIMGGMAEGGMQSPQY